MYTIQIQYDFLSCVVTLIVGIAGFLIGKYEWKKSNDYNKGKNIYDLLAKLRDDDDILEIIELLDYEKLYLEQMGIENVWHLIGDESSDLTKEVDRTLSYFNYICYLLETGIFNKKEKQFFLYELQSLADNDEVIKYLKSFKTSKDMYRSDRKDKFKKDISAFEFLTDYFVKNGWLDLEN